MMSYNFYKAYRLTIFGLMWGICWCSYVSAYPGQDDLFPFVPAAGVSGSTAIDKDDPSFHAWATGYQSLVYGTNVSSLWKTPSLALGPAAGGSYDIVTLGDHGQITLSFLSPIHNRTGADFAVFENSFSSTFLELAWVEVSSDGVHFVRFPNFSYTNDPVGGSGIVDPTNIHGFAGKYQQGQGTPFDLEQLQLAYDAVMNGVDDFSSTYASSLQANFPHLDLNAINYVRIVDVVGDGTALDSEGFVIYEPYPTSGSGGFDLDAIGVINQVGLSGSNQTILFAEVGHQRIADVSVSLAATASSGLPVSYTVQEGPATVIGNQLSFTGYGQVVIQANQSGDGSFAPAVPVTQSLWIADELQHILFVPPSNHIVGATDVQLSVESNSGLPVSLFVDAGPASAVVDELNHTFSSGPTSGTVELRASLEGGEVDGKVYAPATDVIVTFNLVAVDSAQAPKSLSQWQSLNALPQDSTLDSDGDGASDLAEYVGGTDANDASDRPDVQHTLNEATMQVVVTVSQLAQFDMAVETATELGTPSPWSNAVPQIVDQQYTEVDGQPVVLLTIEMPRDDAPSQFWRLSLGAN